MSIFFLNISTIIFRLRRGDIERECKQLLALQNMTDLEAFAQYFFKTKKINSKDYCIDVSYDKLSEYYRNVTWNFDLMEGWDWERQWLYQTCSEYGFFQSSDSLYQPYSDFPIQFYYQKCADFFDSEM